MLMGGNFWMVIDKPRAATFAKAKHLTFKFNMYRRWDSNGSYRYLKAIWHKTRYSKLLLENHGQPSQNFIHNEFRHTFQLFDTNLLLPRTTAFTDGRAVVIIDFTFNWNPQATIPFEDSPAVAGNLKEVDWIDEFTQDD